MRELNKKIKWLDKNVKEAQKEAKKFLKNA